ncbi:hypothetical protein J3Q64DRAFT_1715007 [Phycomyces blakesleeanus]|uniref:RGS domain-containing protein n=1 Tax=Phycomyces blakesleeanus TaxID=4837 RepID=A0ABR3BG93_PHYBL
MTTKAIPSDLPTLDDVLNRRTLPPVCLYNFYIVMRDRLHMEEILDFYLDVKHHELLWKRYIKSLQRSGFVTEEDLAEGYQSNRLLSRLSHTSSMDEKRPGLSHLSSPTTRPHHLQPPRSMDLGERSGNSIRISQSSGLSNIPVIRPPIIDPSITVTPRQPVDEEAAGVLTTESMVSGNPSVLPPNRQDLANSAQRILLKYIVPSAQKELVQLPPPIRQAIRDALQGPEPRDDPLVYADAKQYAFEAMQRQAYPKFLRLKVWGNVTLWQQLGRLAIGLLGLLAGFATSLSLIFLGYPQWHSRFGALVPFWVGIYNVFVFLTGLDPLWVLLFNISETVTFRFNKIAQPRVKEILWSRSIWLLIASIVVSMVITIIFSAIPPRRL